jgi:hypothetical protein
MDNVPRSVVSKLAPFESIDKDRQFLDDFWGEPRENCRSEELFHEYEICTAPNALIEVEEGSLISIIIAANECQEVYIHTVQDDIRNFFLTVDKKEITILLKNVWEDNRNNSRELFTNLFKTWAEYYQVTRLMQRFSSAREYDLYCMYRNEENLEKLSSKETLKVMYECYGPESAWMNTIYAAYLDDLKHLQLNKTVEVSDTMTITTLLDKVEHGCSTEEFADILEIIQARISNAGALRSNTTKGYDSNLTDLTRIIDTLQNYNATKKLTISLVNIGTDLASCKRKEYTNLYQQSIHFLKRAWFIKKSPHKDLFNYFCFT